MKNKIKFNKKFISLTNKCKPIQITVSLFLDILIEIFKIMKELISYILSALFGVWLTLYFIDSTINLNELAVLFSQSIYAVFLILLFWFLIIIIVGFLILEWKFYKKTIYNLFIFVIGLFIILLAFLKYSPLTQEIHGFFRFLSFIFFVILGLIIAFKSCKKKPTC